MAKLQRSNRETKKPKQTKAKPTVATSPMAAAQARATMIGTGTGKKK